MNNDISKSGQTSIFLPGSRGNSGRRGNITYFSTEKASSDPGSISFDYEDESYSVNNTLTDTSGNPLTPTPGDYIMLANQSNNTVTMFLVESADSYRVTVSFIDKINVQYNINDIAPSDITIIANGTTSPLTKMVSFKELSAIGAVQFPDGYKVNSNTKLKFSFKTKISNGTLGKYRIVLEFITQNTSPAMCSNIARKFNKQNISNLYTKLGGSDLCDYRGYLYLYDRENAIEKNYPNFDNEYLDNFELIIKDYNEGVGSQEFTKYVNIQSSVIFENDYKCYAYIYLPSTTGLSEKCIIGEINLTQALT